MLCFYFHISQNILKFFLWYLLWSFGHFGVCWLISIYLWISKISFCCWFLSSFHYGQRACFVWFQSFYILLRLVAWPGTWLIPGNAAYALEKSTSLSRWETCSGDVCQVGLVYSAVQLFWFCLVLDRTFVFVSSFFIHISMLYRAPDIYIFIVNYPFIRKVIFSYFRYLSQTLVLHCWLYFTLKLSK